MADYLERGIEVLGALQRSSEYLSAAELANRLGITTRSVRRIIADLKHIGFGIESVPGPHGGYRLGPGKRIALLLPSENEIVALLAGLQSAAAMGLQDPDIDHQDLTEKLLRVLPQKHRSAALDLSRYVESYRPPIPTTSARSLRELAKYCRLRMTLEITYTSDGVEEPAQLVEPHRIVQNEYLWYLLAWNQQSRCWRHYRVDRITSMRAASKRFVQRELPTLDAAGFTVNTIATAPYAYRVEAVFAASAEELAGSFPPDSVHIEAIDDHSCVVHTGAASYEIVAVYLLAPGVPFSIRYPAEMRQHMLDSARRLWAAAEGTAPASGKQK
ncbi:WYL domain-containing protein [Leucobacter insecticola]|uniref:WYL domain-containing protein n=1 Tax=Leucobacter insecticola TaxID=2714934 RepID=A0A6G8FJ40_9MICO|nr:WYL domain-containing protein [Leucobacter insecticola]QIM16313.1 WYL domain-containing protein [Leucobacter insecticola]